MEQYRYSGKIRPSKQIDSGLPAIFDVLFIVCDRLLIYYTHKFWVFGGHVAGRCQGLFPPHLQSQGKAPRGRGWREMSWIRSPVVTSRSLYSSRPSVTRLHACILLYLWSRSSNFCRFLANMTLINLQHWSVSASLSPKICFWRSRHSCADSRVPREIGEREKIRRQRGSPLFFLLISICAALTIWRSWTGY